MSNVYLPARLRQQVEERARHRCEYCQTQELIIGMPLEAEHIIPVAAGGATDAANLCLACPRCNRYKGTQTELHDSITGEKVALFNPRQQQWHEHFIWQSDGLLLVGLTPTGRATINALQLNNRFILRSRQLWIAQGWHPPQNG
ncbi:MAG: HNH endonuclease [Caldilineaceae bacterium]